MIRKKINPRFNRILKEYINTGSQIEVGRKEPTLTNDNAAASVVSWILSKENVRFQLQEELTRRGLGIDMIANKLAKLSDAKKTIYATSEGKITDTMELEDNQTQARALEIAIDIFGGREKHIPNANNGDETDLSKVSDEELNRLIEIGNAIDADYEVL